MGGFTAGALYLVTEAILTKLDLLEGHPHFYRRGPVHLEDGRLALTYFLSPEQHPEADLILCWPPTS